MRWIVNRSPFYEKETHAALPQETVLVRPYQMVVWVSLRVRDVISPPFPAVLDSGHSHNFSIGTEHLEEWAGIKSADVRRIGVAKVNERPVALIQATVLLHRNVRGARDQLRRDPWQLQVSEGIALHERGDRFAPRLPILGLRSIVRAGLRVLIDGKKRELSIGKAFLR
ncbi:MAG: hypothetical protein HYS13_03600 [Planctomycetia bacterium]|nr:hypothetical protein [Planctomycetia bacterium]